jgi:hypothetical protein
VYSNIRFKTSLGQSKWVKRHVLSKRWPVSKRRPQTPPCCCFWGGGRVEATTEVSTVVGEGEGELGVLEGRVEEEAGGVTVEVSGGLWLLLFLLPMTRAATHQN